jgi:Putative Flp pilus-assembly TadE/G-like
MEFRMKRSFEAFGLRWSRTRERGATAVVIALTLVLVMGAAAISVDIANLALQRQQLSNITDAAAQAGAVYLRDNPGDPAGARQAALTYAIQYEPTFTAGDVTLWCIVASTGATKQIADGNIPAVCDPGLTTNKICDEYLCAIPCPLSGATCNAVQVKKDKNVPFYFAPAIGINSGSTGAVASVSCAKSCGSGGKPNPMDVAIIADRTPSMNMASVYVDGAWKNAYQVMQASIETSLETMTPEYQFVTLGTIHESNPDFTTNPDKSSPKCLTGLGPAKYSPTGGGGKWMPLGFSNNYLTGNLTSPAGTRKLIMTASKTNLGYQVACMDSRDPGNAPWNTHLAAPLKAAARVLLGKSGTTSGITAQMTADRNALTKNTPVSKWIIFETDGQPWETMTASNDIDLNHANDPSAPDNNNNNKQACLNLKNEAAAAKASGNDIHIIMIAFGNDTTAQCGNLGTVRDVMAAAASPRADGSASVAPSDCTTANSDGDFFFCATTGDELKSIFTTAVGQASASTTKFVRMPS